MKPTKVLYWCYFKLGYVSKCSHKECNDDRHLVLADSGKGKKK